MTTLALRVPTAVPDQPNVSGGQCYILFTTATVSVRDLIAAKVQAELRKARMGGMQATSLALLLPPGATVGFGPLDEQLAIAQACRAFIDGQYLLLYNGRPLVALDEQVLLDRRTSLLFLHVPVTPAEPAAAIKRAA
jgi:hypothetical protein